MQIEHPVQTTPGKLSAKNIAAGVFLVAIAVLGLFINQEYQRGSPAQMGPGYMPMLVFTLLALMGSAVIVLGLSR